MKTKWDYTELAQSYVKRPAYSDEGIDRIVSNAGLGAEATICDVGAGVAHLTIPLAQKGFLIDAVEPNDAMRTLGIKRTSDYPNVTWHEGIGEKTEMETAVYDLVTFGSSFNVTDRPVALQETSRILKPLGWFTCMWNHRNFDDPLQSDVENIIKSMVPEYGYGSRREDQTAVIDQSGLFDEVIAFEAPVMHEEPAIDWIEAWRSHATLARQAGTNFRQVVDAISERVKETREDILRLPYTTRIWMARKST